MSAARANSAWARFRRDRAGMVGVGVLLFFALVALCAPFLADRSELSVLAGQNNEDFASPSSAYPLGTDGVGRDVLAQLIWGARVSLYVGVLAALVAGVLGTVVGLAAGYLTGRASRLLMALDDFVLVIPFIPLCIVLAVVLGRSPTVLAFVIGATSWAGSARVLRAQVLSVRERTYVERARALGASDWRIVRSHILPGVAPLIVATVTLIVPAAILAESTLSFLGLGDPFSPSWGKMLDDAKQYSAFSKNAWWYFVPPGLCIIAVVLAFTALGRALERVLDPRLDGR